MTENIQFQHLFMNRKLKCVMLVDDDRLTDFLNKIIIDNAAVTDHVERCHSVQSALSYLSSSLKDEVNFPFPELIFLDMRMPEESGWKFIDHFKAIKKDIPLQPVIIMLSAVGNARDVLAASNLAEFSAFYTKPLTPELLDRIIKDYFISD